MLLRYPATSYLYHYGLHAGLPYGMLKEVANLCDASQMPIEYLERKRLALEAQGNAEGAADASARFEAAWAHADVEIGASRI